MSAALHDLAAKRLGVPLYRMWGLDPAASPPTSFTIGIAPDEATLRARVREAAQYPVLKIKLGTSWDERIVRVVRELAPTKVLRVDANAAWTPKHALAMIPLLQELGVEFVEQPLPAHDIDGLALRARAVGAADRRRRELSRGDRHPEARRRGRRHQHQAREVRRTARSAAHDRDGARALACS